MKYLSIVLVLSLVALASTSGCERSSDPGEVESPGASPATERESAKPSEAEAQAPEAESSPDKKPLVEKARKLADLRTQIEKSPESIDELLEKAKLTEDELEDLLFEIAEDPEASAAYAQAD